MRTTVTSRRLAATTMGEFSRGPAYRTCTQCHTRKSVAAFQQGRYECRECRHGEDWLHASLETTLDTSEAACSTVDPDTWFSDSPEHVETAIRICHTCPIMDACRAWGMEHESHGVWGGVRIRTGNLVKPSHQRQARALLASGESVDTVAARTGIPTRRLRRWAA